MAVIAVGLHLQQGRAVAAPGPLNSPPCRLVHCLRVLAVYHLARDAVAGRPIGHVLDRDGVLGIGELGVVVVLTDEDGRQLLDGRPVQRLVKLALAGGAIPEERHRDLVGAPVLRRKCRPRHDPEPASDDPVAAKHPHREIRDVHAATLAAAHPGRLAHDLGRHLVHPGALGQGVAVPSMGRGDVVILAEGRADAGRHRLLADVQVHEAGQARRQEHLAHPLLERPDAGH